MIAAGTAYVYRYKPLLLAFIVQAGLIAPVHSEPRSTPMEPPLPHNSALATESAQSPCQLELADIAEFKPAPPITGPGECKATDPLNVEAVLLPGNQRVVFNPTVLLQCSMAKVVAQWIRDDVAPTLDKSGMVLRGIDTLESYGCRTFNGVKGAKLSEHGHANALDVQSLKLANGTRVELNSATVSKALREQLRQTACSQFSTVLGNGADGFHENHVHIDLMQRTNDYKICQWTILDTAEVAAIAQKSAIVPEDPTPSAIATPSDVPMPQPRPVASGEAASSQQSNERSPQAPIKTNGHFDTAIVGPWTVRTSSNNIEDCAITRTVDVMKFEIAKTPAGWRLLLQSPKWKLENGKAYDVHLVTNRRSVEAKASAAANSAVIPIDEAFIETLGAANALQVVGAGATLSIPLDESRSALAQLSACLSGNTHDAGLTTNPFVSTTNRVKRDVPTRRHRRWSDFPFFR